MKNRNKRGFTIVELVIVVAVIAILAAVLIPTFVGLVAQANQSADQQAVANMNKLLAISDIPEDVDDVIDILIANDYAGDLTTYYAKYSLAWVAEKNVIVLVEDGAVVFPEQYAGLAFEIIKPMASDAQAVIDSMESGKTVYINANVTAKGTDDFKFTTSGDYALNLNGKTLTTNDQGGGIYASGEGTKITLSNGIVSGASTSTAIAAYDGGELDIDNLIITDSKGVSIQSKNGAKVSVRNTKVYGANGTNPIQCYGGNLTLDEVIAVQSGEAATVWYDSAVQVVNLIQKNEEGKYVIKAQASTTINSGSYTGDKAIQISAPGGNVTINGGTFTTTGTYVIQDDFAPQNYIDGSNYESVITINGGTFDGQFKVSSATVVVLNGGTFTFEPNASWIGEGHTVVNNGNGTWTVK